MSTSLTPNTPATSTRVRQSRFPAPKGGGETALDAGLIPVEELAALAAREGQRPRPVYQSHRWFARRFGSAFRGLLTAAAIPADSDFWSAYYAGVELDGKVVLDPFVGGGTSVVEALRLGADVVGVDVDAVACAITRFETRLASLPDLMPALEELTRDIGGRLSSFYQTTTPEGIPEDVLHYFWVQVVGCRACGEKVEAHPHYQLAYENDGELQWVFCPGCHQVQELSRSRKRLSCWDCGIRPLIGKGPVEKGVMTCPQCGEREPLIKVAGRTGRPPEWRLFALETVVHGAGRRVVPLRERYFRPATEHDLRVFAKARRELRKRADADGHLRWIPERAIPSEGRCDSRPLSYGYTRYAEMFNDRQLLHLSVLAEAISAASKPVREALAVAFSDHLTTNCMLTHYAFGWRRLSPLFSVRAFRHVSRPVEVNPWMDGTGRGTFPNAVRQIQRAAEWARSPQEPLLEGGFRQAGRPVGGPGASGRVPGVKVFQGSSQRLSQIKPSSVDLVLTDPPYFDNISYSELSDFFLPWLQKFGLASSGTKGESGLRGNLAAKGRNGESVLAFQRCLGDCFGETARTLKPDGRLIFTYQHKTPGGWAALAHAIAHAGLRAVQLFPLLGDGDKGLHTEDGSIKWDAVFVLSKDLRCRKASDLRLTEQMVREARSHSARWQVRLMNISAGAFRAADRQNFERACLVGAALGLFLLSSEAGPLVRLTDLL